MKSRERVEHIIAVQTAWKEGKQIEQSLKCKDEWKDMYTPFDWAVYDYRIKPDYKCTTIEERAEMETSLFSYRYGYQGAKEAYIAGAKAQGTMDIDKACEWLCLHCEDVKYDWNLSLLLEDFRKAMEE